jgi:hypothetical protein
VSAPAYPTRSRAQIFADLANPPERQWKRDPVSWAKVKGGIDLWSRQQDIIRSVRDHSKTAVHSCHEIGKSFIAATTVCWWLDVHTAGEAFVVTTAPTAPQVEAILWREINRIHTRAGLRGRTNLTEWYIGKELVAFGRKPSDYNTHAFQGVHARYFLVVLDEACGIPKSLWDAASTLAANEHSRTLAIGNPDDPNGEFADNCKPDSGWNVIQVGYKDTPNFTGEPVSQLVADSLIHPVWVEDRRKKWGPESALFQSKCEGFFPTVGSPWQVVPYKWANQCRYLDLPSGSKPIEAGVDVGAGNDRTVVTIREGNKIKDIVWFVDSDPIQTAGQVALCLKEHKVTCTKVDSIGIGWGLYGLLRSTSSKYNQDGSHVHDSEIVPINVGMGPTPGNEERFLNRRAEMWWDIGRERSRLNLWDFSGLEKSIQDDLIHELTMPEYQILDAKGKVKIEPKEKIRERLNASPDLAESALLAFVPANWTAETHTNALLASPSLLSAYGASDMIGHDTGFSPEWALRGGWTQGR